MKIKTSELYAFAVGYYDARSKGNENCPFDLDHLKSMYNLGYEAGIHDYCRENHPEDEEA